jgi:hypothetical protein
MSMSMDPKKNVIPKFAMAHALMKLRWGHGPWTKDQYQTLENELNQSHVDGPLKIRRFKKRK